MKTDLEHPQLYQPDENGDMQPVARGEDGFIDVEDYRTLYRALEELRAPVLEGGGYSHCTLPWSGCNQVCHVISRNGRVVLNTYMVPLGSEAEQELDAFLELGVNAANERSG